MVNTDQTLNEFWDTELREGKKRIAEETESYFSSEELEVLSRRQTEDDFSKDDVLQSDEYSMSRADFEEIVATYRRETVSSYEDAQEVLEEFVSHRSREHIEAAVEVLIENRDSLNVSEPNRTTNITPDVADRVDESKNEVSKTISEHGAIIDHLFWGELVDTIDIDASAVDVDMETVEEGPWSTIATNVLEYVAKNPDATSGEVGDKRFSKPCSVNAILKGVLFYRADNANEVRALVELLDDQQVEELAFVADHRYLSNADVSRVIGVDGGDVRKDMRRDLVPVLDAFEEYGTDTLGLDYSFDVPDEISLDEPEDAERSRTQPSDSEDVYVEGVYVCDVCEKEFDSANARNGHKASHSESSPSYAESSAEDDSSPVNIPVEAVDEPEKPTPEENLLEAIKRDILKYIMARFPGLMAAFL